MLATAVLTGLLTAIFVLLFNMIIGFFIDLFDRPQVRVIEIDIEGNVKKKDSVH